MRLYAHVFFVCLFMPPAWASYLSYVDENGTRHIVQSEEEIPEQFRVGAKKSLAGDSSKSFYQPGTPYVSDPADSPRASCDKEAQYNFDEVRKRLFSREDGALNQEEMKDFAELMARRDREKERCKQRFPEAEPAKEKGKRHG